jgi:salicylate hydroxylase
MLPFMAQGAAQAIEDAATLAACLNNTAVDVPTALRAYVALRKPRTTVLQERSQDFSKTFHLHDGPEQQARDEAYATVGLRGNPDAMSRLYGHDAESATGTYADR